MNETELHEPGVGGQRRAGTMLAVVTLGVAILALATPFSRAESPAGRVGGLLAVAAVLEGLHALRRASAAEQRQAATGAAISMAIALALINAPFIAGRALRLVLAGWFGLDAVRAVPAAVRATAPAARWLAVLRVLGNGAVAVWLLLGGGWVVDWVVSIAGAARIAGIAWNILGAEVLTTEEADETIVDELGLSDDPRAVAMAREVEELETARRPVDREWTLAFVATLFAIHMGRMRTEWTILGLVSPAVAILGDMALAIAVTLLVVNPLYLLWRKPTRWIERRLWVRRLGADRARSGRTSRLLDAWLRWRFVHALRMRAARYSIPAALSMGLQSGLPFAAIVAATVPVWGMNWYFDTENWAAGIWNSWAASRTDTWREAMVTAVLPAGAAAGSTPLFAVNPPGVESGDFSFVVIGDPGEGDASQHVLRDQLITVTNRPDVRFVVVSSDVVYPAGSMNDYEAKFWLPFKGVTRPVYAIPGNHDWYDALEGFAATFLEPDAARASIRARIVSDYRITSTTDTRIEALLGEAARLREEYGVPTGFQRAPFFELQTDRFALLAIDTGVLRSVDGAQAAWMAGALERARGKTTVAILGHPFIAGGADATAGDDAFAGLKRTLAAHGVAVVMAGDTHDLEFYREPATSTSPARLHFVNGGGGAYLSFGTALAWPDHPFTADWAHYPSREAVTRKIDATTPWWKRPAWWWTRGFGAWPFSAEWLSAAFDANVAPFFQSFIEIRVEPSAGRIRLIPYGVHGQLTWRDLATSDAARAPAVSEAVEWVVEMPPPAPR